MTGSGSKRILVVANRTAATPLLLAEVHRRAGEEDCRFDLLIPDAADRAEAEPTLALALPLLEEASGKPVEGLSGGPDPLETVRRVQEARHYDEIILSTLPEGFSNWLGRNLPRSVCEIGVPVTVVTASRRAAGIA
jgi:hypothetical protein